MAKVREPEKLRVFVSYSRRDSKAADDLVEALSARGFDVTIDRRDLPFGEKWQSELAEFIRLSDTVLWLVSEASVQSKWVNWELDEVAKRNKRLVPVMISEADRGALPRQIGEIHILPADRMFDFSRDLDALVQVLETDRVWLKEASRLQDRAHEWLSKSRNAALLLSRGALVDAERWKDRRPAKAPAPAQEVMGLLLASRQAATRRQRWWVGGSFAVAVGAMALAGVAYLQSLRAERSEAATRRISDETQATESGLLARSARTMSDDQAGRDAGTALLLALEGLPDKSSDDSVKRDRKYESVTALELDGALRRLQELRVLAGHEGAISALEVSPDGRYIVTASWDDFTVRVWDQSSGAMIRQWKHDHRVICAKWSSDGRRVIAASADDNAIVWSLDSADPMAVVATNAGSLNYGHSCPSFAPSGHRFIVVPAYGIHGPSGTNPIIYENDGSELIELIGHEQSVTAVAWKPDGSQVGTTSWDRTARVWNARDGKPVAELKGHCPADRSYGSGGCRVHQIAWSDQGTAILTTADDSTVRVWDAVTGEELSKFEHDESVKSAAFSKSGKRLLTVAWDNIVRIWPTTGGEAVLLRGHGKEVTSAAWSDDGDRIVSSSADGTSRIWDAYTGQELARLEGHLSLVQVARWLADGSRVVTASKDGTIRLWDAEPQSDTIVLRGHEKTVLDVSWSGEGSRIATASSDGSVRVWNAATGRELAAFTVHKGEASSLTWSGDGASIVSTAKGDVARLWSSNTGKQIASLGAGCSQAGQQDADCPIDFASFTAQHDVVTAARTGVVTWNATAAEQAQWSLPPEHKTYWNFGATQVLAIGKDGTSHVLDARDGNQVALLNDQGGAFGIAWSHDGTKIVGGRYENPGIWNAATGHRIVSLKGLTGLQQSAEWSHDDRRIAITVSGKTQIFDAGTGNEIVSMAVGLAETEWSPDDQLIATRSFVESLLQVWDTRTGTEVARGSQRDGSTFRVKWAPGSPGHDLSRRLAVSAGNTTRIVKVYLNRQALVEAAKQRAPRCLTAAQRSEYFLPEAPPSWCVERRLWPYNDETWQEWLPKRKNWLAAGRQGREPKLPKSE